MSLTELVRDEPASANHHLYCSLPREAICKSNNYSKLYAALSTTVGRDTGSCSSTCHTKRPPQTLSAFLVHLFQVHPAHSHYLTDQINLLSAQVLVPQVLVDKSTKKERMEREKGAEEVQGEGIRETNEYGNSRCEGQCEEKQRNNAIFLKEIRNKK